MKVEINGDGVVAVFVVACALIILTLIIGGYFYNAAKNELILKADTCEKALIIDGTITEKLMLCRLVK